jgi:hypothetical protein
MEHTLDINRLIQAIESPDYECRLALYAEDAHLHIIDFVHPRRTECLLQGKAEIEQWLAAVDSDLCNRVIGVSLRQDRFLLVQQHRQHDGTEIVYTSHADIHLGRINREVMTIEAALKQVNPTGALGSQGVHTVMLHHAGPGTTEDDAPPRHHALDDAECESGREESSRN